MKFKLFGITDVGRVRDHNEDNFAVCKDLSTGEWNFEANEVRALSKRGTLLIVADGMGGANAGEIASNLAQKSVKEQFQQLKKMPRRDAQIIALLGSFILKAHDDIVEYQKANLDAAGMGTTLIIAWILNDTLYVCWSGDSRCYVFNTQTPLYPFTNDHSHVWQQVSNQQISTEEARLHPESNLITQHLGDPKERPEPEGKQIKLQAGDRVLVCSDGLNGMISDAQIHYLLLEHEGTAEACKQLVGEAKKAGGEDNITVLLFDVDPDAATAASTIPRKATKYTKPTSSAGVLTSYFIPVLLVLLLIFGYHFFFNNSPLDNSRNVTLGTKVINLNGKSYINLDPQTAFLPAGPKIETELINTPKLGDTVLRGAQILYTVNVENAAAAFPDTISIKMHGEGYVTFTAAYILRWKPLAKEPRQGLVEIKPDTTAQDSTVKFGNSKDKEIKADSTSQDSIFKLGNRKDEEISPPDSGKGIAPDSIVVGEEIDSLKTDMTVIQYNYQ